VKPAEGMECWRRKRYRINRKSGENQGNDEMENSGNWEEERDGQVSSQRR